MEESKNPYKISRKNFIGENPIRDREEIDSLKTLSYNS
jgi:hypothetical protein